VKSSISFPAGLAADAGAEAGDEVGEDAGEDAGALLEDAELVVVEVVVDVVVGAEVLAGEQAMLPSSKLVTDAANINFFIGDLLSVIYKWEFV
jgi:hypothetical protein